MNGNGPLLTCMDPALGELLVPYGLGTLSVEDSMRFEDHLMECAFCRTELEAGFAAFEKLHDLRSELVEELKGSGQDYESRLAELRTKPASERQPEDWWRRALDSIRRPWVYAPVVTGVAALLLIIQLANRPSPVPASRQMETLSPMIAQSHAVTRMPESAPPTSASGNGMSQNAAPESAMKLKAMPLPEMAASDEMADNSPKPVAQSLTSPESRQSHPLSPDLMAPLSAERSTYSAVRVPAEEAPAKSAEISGNVADAGTESPSTEKAFAMRAEVSPAATELHARLSELLQNPPSFTESRPAVAEKHDISARAGRGPQGVLESKGTTPDSAVLDRVARKAASADSRDFLTGMAAYQTRDFAKAAEALGKAAHGNPTDSRTWFYLGVSRFQTGQWKSAIQALTTANNLSNGSDPLTRYYLCLATLQSGDSTGGRSLVDSVFVRHDSLSAKVAELKRLLDASTRPK